MTLVVPGQEDPEWTSGEGRSAEGYNVLREPWFNGVLRWLESIGIEHREVVPGVVEMGEPVLAPMELPKNLMEFEVFMFGDKPK